MKTDPVDHLLKSFAQQDDFDLWLMHDDLHASRIEVEERILRSWRELDSPDFFVPGFCVACRQICGFQVSIPRGAVSGERDWATPNWRESLSCVKCRLNRRARAALAIVTRTLRPAANIWIAECDSPLVHQLAKTFSNVQGSEFFGEDHLPGEEARPGMRHEDCTRSSFGDETLDAVLSFDVLEHVPNYVDAFREAYRTLRAGGTFFWGAPFGLGLRDTLVRAVVNRDGSITHLLEPEFHGDPLRPDTGILCFQHFGWDVIDDLRRCGFGDAHVMLYWSLSEGIVGPLEVFVCATKQGDGRPMAP